MRPLLLAAASGFVFAASTPPLDFQLGILVGLVGFAVALAGASRRAGAWRGFFFGLAANLLALRFVPDVVQHFTSLPAIAAWTALVLLSAAQALPWALAGALARILFPTLGGVAFGVAVYAATFVPAVFPWTPAGGLGRWPILLQTAELVGERGTSFLLAAACGFAAEAILKKSRPLGALAVALVIGLVGYGAIRMRAVDQLRSDAPHARVALLQPDFDAMFRWDESRARLMMDRLSALTRKAEEAGAILTVWPESAYPYTLAHGIKRSPNGVRAVLQQGVRGPVLTGAYLSMGGGLGTNSAILVRPNGEIEPSYDKRHLLWFGETVPLAETFPALRQIFARGTGIVPGTIEIAFRSGPIVASVLNCYEDTLPTAGREAMAVRPNLLVNVTNDAWFSGSAEGELHLRLAVLRAIETRRDFVRAVNRGPTSWIDANGRILLRHEGTESLGPSPPLLADVALLSAPITVYARVGDAPLAALILIAIAVRIFTKHRGRLSRSEKAPARLGPDVPDVTQGQGRTSLAPDVTQDQDDGSAITGSDP